MCDACTPVVVGTGIFICEKQRIRTLRRESSEAEFMTVFINGAQMHESRTTWAHAARHIGHRPAFYAALDGSSQMDWEGQRSSANRERVNWEMSSTL